MNDDREAVRRHGADFANIPFESKHIHPSTLSSPPRAKTFRPSARMKHHGIE